MDGNITIPAPDLSSLETKEDVKKALDAKADKADLDSKADKTDLDSKADKTDVTTLQATVTGLSTKVDSVVTKLSDGTLAKVAHFKASEEQKAVDWRDAIGRISAEFVIVYPPGAPLLVPGEVITQELNEKVRHYQKVGLNLQGMQDKTLQKICIVTE